MFKCRQIVMDWKNWCRLCGSIEGSTVISEKVFILALQLFEVRIHIPFLHSFVYS